MSNTILEQLHETQGAGASAAGSLMLPAAGEALPVAEGLTLQRDENGLFLESDGQILRGDFTRMLPRIKASNLSSELLVKAAKIKAAKAAVSAPSASAAPVLAAASTAGSVSIPAATPLTAIDATAGLGEDSLLLAAAGFHVHLYERNPVIFALLQDAHRRAAAVPELAEIVSRMTLHNEDSTAAMAALAADQDGENAPFRPDVVLLDPMFPARQKSSLVKKKLQMIQKLEIPCDDEAALLRAAMETCPKKLIIKRPPKGPYLAGLKPDHSLSGKAVRFDCFTEPHLRLHKFKF